MKYSDEEVLEALELSATEMPKELGYGIFWCLAETQEELDEKHLYTVIKPCSLDGIPQDVEGLDAKSGLTYNHKSKWATLPKEITRGKPFDYYPRGRVEITRNKATIWLNGNLIELADEVKRLYGLSALSSVQVREDGSDHYKCHFDR